MILFSFFWVVILLFVSLKMNKGSIRYFWFFLRLFLLMGVRFVWVVGFLRVGFRAIGFAWCVLCEFGYFCVRVAWFRVIFWFYG